MRDYPKKTEAPQFLSGWKEIANYLGKGVRTVQRYECYLGLPVRRPAGKSRVPVMATKAELDAWVGASPLREAFYLTKPPDDGQHQASATAMKNGLAEMRKLREQMMALRVEVETTVHLLRESIWALGGDMNRQWRGNASALTVLDPESRTEDVFDLLGAATRLRKAS